MDATWWGLIAGQLTSAELPEELDLSDVLNAMERLWQLTDQDGCKHGACIVLGADGRLKLDHEVVGDIESAKPMHRVGDYSDHLGFFHTHPLYADRTEQVGFSEYDFAGALQDGEWLSVVRSGRSAFALMRTEQTPAPSPVSSQEEAEFFAVFNQYLGTIN
jgi:hypothetical protein